MAGDAPVTAGESDWMEGLEPRTPVITRRKRLLELVLRLFPQRIAWRLRFLSAHHRWPRSSPPRTFNEKVLWRITEDRRPLIGMACDKLASKRFVAERCPDVVIPEVFWKGDDLRELVGVDLPGRWVLKPNNGYGRVRFGEGPLGAMRVEELARETADWLDYPFLGRPGHRVEWGYTQAEKCFLVEEFVGDGDLPPTDYKFRVFGGVVRQITVVEDFFGDASMTAFSPSWERLSQGRALYPAGEGAVEKPRSFDSMMACASRIGASFDFIRIDFYDSPQGAVFGELTAYPAAGLMPTHPRSADLALGAHWTLPFDAGAT